MTDSLDRTADTLMRAVAASGVVTPENMPAAIDIMRSELRSFLYDDRYADERDCLLRRSLSEQAVIGIVALNCIEKIKEL